jgi:chemotaxis protein CheX
MAEISREELQAVVDEVFQSMVNIEILPSPECRLPNQRTGYMASAVQIVGGWQGAVRVDIDERLARDVCASLMSVPGDELSSRDILDAVGELANIVGGSVKALLAADCGLSLPSVVAGRDFEFKVIQGTRIQDASFTHPSGGLTVSVIERNPA